MFFRYSVTPPHPTAKPSWGWLRVGVRKPRLVLAELGRRGIKLRRHQGPTGGAVPEHNQKTRSHRPAPPSSLGPTGRHRQQLPLPLRVRCVFCSGNKASLTRHREFAYSRAPPPRAYMCDSSIIIEVRHRAALGPWPPAPPAAWIQIPPGGGTPPTRARMHVTVRGPARARGRSAPTTTFLRRRSCN